MDSLRGEEELLARLVVESAVEWPVPSMVGCIGGKLEEEDDAINWVQLCECVWVKRQELLKLDILNPKLVEEVGEYSLCEMNGFLPRQ